MGHRHAMKKISNVCLLHSAFESAAASRPVYEVTYYAMHCKCRGSEGPIAFFVKFSPGVR